jgi:plastocyanin
MKKTIGYLSALYIIVFATVVFASSQYEVGQKNKQFTVNELKIKVGESVSFPNYDPFFHNVFSLSPTKTFDLGSYPKGETRIVTFDKPGKVDVECAIHPNMHMTIFVE